MDGIVSLKTINSELIALETKTIKTESLYLLLLLAIFIIIFKIVFYKEALFTLVWAVVSFFLTFTIPGFILCYLWHDKLDFTERFIIGNMLGLVSVGILSYNISVWIGINIKIISIITPILITLIYGGMVYLMEKKKSTINNL